MSNHPEPECGTLPPSWAARAAENFLCTQCGYVHAAVGECPPFRIVRTPTEVADALKAWDAKQSGVVDHSTLNVRASQQAFALLAEMRGEIELLRERVKQLEARGIGPVMTDLIKRVAKLEGVEEYGPDSRHCWECKDRLDEGEIDICEPCKAEKRAKYLNPET